MRSGKEAAGSRLRTALVCAGLGLAAVAPLLGTLRTDGFIHDDRWIVAGNPLLSGGWKSVGALFTTGYWEAARGKSASVQEYRPVLMLTFLLQRMLTGAEPGPMHAVNLILHGLASILVFLALAGRMDGVAAAVAAVVFAVLPVHTEAVASLTGRSEVLAAALMLGAWLALDRKPPASTASRVAAGCSLYAAAMLTKEHAVLFPMFLALSDRASGLGAPWSRERRGVYCALLGCVILYGALRLTVLSHAAQVGTPYFADTSRLSALLTLSRFAALRYLWPSLSGEGSCPDYSRPLIPDAGPSDSFAWLCLAGLAFLACAAAMDLFRRRPAGKGAPWSFWALAPCVFLLPTSHLLVPLDTLGAERFLYFPSIGLAALMGLLWKKASAAAPWPAGLAAAALVAWYASSTAGKNEVWVSDLSYYAAAVDCNPVSARAHSALGQALVVRGRVEEGKLHLMKAIGLGPRIPQPYYNLARLAWDRRDYAGAESLLRRCLELDPMSPEAWVLLAVVAEKLGKASDSAAALARALAIHPGDPLAHYNFARLCLSRGLASEAAEHFSRFLELAPDDPQAAEIAGLVSRLNPAADDLSSRSKVR
ncbi:MAG: tetratricopeptide repeat protein [Elusimicrobia bacterium]|nr:tetratricopeptide repeat protein [Elusimicrobiota bacterium]